MQQLNKKMCGQSPSGPSFLPLLPTHIYPFTKNHISVTHRYGGREVTDVRRVTPGGPRPPNSNAISEGHGIYRGSLIPAANKTNPKHNFTKLSNASPASLISETEFHKASIIIVEEVCISPQLAVTQKNDSRFLT